MYKVEIYKSVWAGELPGEGGAAAQMKNLHAPYPKQAGFKYIIELAFPPYIGLSVIDEKRKSYIQLRRHYRCNLVCKRKYVCLLGKR